MSVDLTSPPSTVEDASQVFTTPSAYADDEWSHAAWTLLRRNAPICRVEHPRFAPFWALTRHADVHEVSVHNDEFHNAPRSMLQSRTADRLEAERGRFLRTLVNMDAPDHKAYRDITSAWFLPKSLAGLNARMADLARRSVDRMAELGAGCDFARDIAMQYPLQMILALLGLPESDYGRLLRLTQEMFGGADSSTKREGSPTEAAATVVADFFAYFGELTDQRRGSPQDDLASVIANARIDGRLLEPLECVSYYVIVATAGHDTTASAMAGGLQALIEHPDQLNRLREDPNLLNTAVDEMIRWVTPVKQFMRTAAVPYELSGHRFEPGDDVLLSYPSANRDEAVFAEPFSFDVGRNPNKHLAFGFGAHFCLGAMLARMEMRSLFRELIGRVDDLALAGQPQLMRTLFVGGLKSLPIRYEVVR